MIIGLPGQKALLKADMHYPVGRTPLPKPTDLFGNTSHGLWLGFFVSTELIYALCVCWFTNLLMVGGRGWYSILSCRHVPGVCPWPWNTGTPGLCALKKCPMTPRRREGWPHEAPCAAGIHYHGSIACKSCPFPEPPTLASLLSGVSFPDAP